MKPKLTTMADAVAGIGDGDLVGIAAPEPMATVREIIRQRKRDLRLVAFGIPAELLVGAGCVSEIHSANIMSPLGGVSPVVRRAAEAGAVKIRPHGEITLLLALWAGMMNLEFVPLAGYANDIPRTHPEWTTLTSPVTGRELVLVTPIKPDVTILHVPRADRFGNATGRDVLSRRVGAEYWTSCLAKAAGRLILCAEEIVPTEAFLARPELTWIRHHEVTAVVHCPGASHPVSLTGHYDADLRHLGVYRQATRDGGAFATYLATYIHGTSSEEEYRALVARA